jgi:hypothetical protein
LLLGWGEKGEVYKVSGATQDACNDQVGRQPKEGRQSRIQSVARENSHLEVKECALWFDDGHYRIVRADAVRFTLCDTSAARSVNLSITGTDINNVLQPNVQS